MRSAIVVVLALALFLLSPVEAGEKRDAAEAAFFKALYLEQGRRDLEKAEAAYTEFLWEHEEERDLAARAWLGLARIGAQTSAKTSVPNLDEVAKILEDMKKRDSLPKEVLAAIEKELDEARELVEFTSRFPEVRNQLVRLTRHFTLGPDDENAKSSIAALVPFGDRAVPQMSSLLDSRNPLEVACAAQVLVRIRSEAGNTALVRVLEDPATLYPGQVAEQLRYAEPFHAKVFEAGLMHPTATIRLTVAKWLVNVAGSRHTTHRYDPILQDIMFSALGDADPMVRRTLLKADWSDAVAVPAVLRGFADDDSANRTLAAELLRQVQQSRGTVETPPEVAPPLLGLLDHDDPGVRRAAFHLLRRMKGEPTQQAFVRALRSSDRDLLQQALASLLDTPRTIEVQDALLFAAEQCLAGPTTATQARWYMSLQKHIFDSSADWDLKKLCPLLARMHRWPLRFQENPYQAPFTSLVAMLGALPQERIAGDFVREACDSLQSDQQKAAWLRTFSVRLGEERFEIAKKEIHSKSDSLRAFAAGILSEPGCPHERLLGRPLLADSDSRVRLLAARAILQREGTEFLEELLEFVAADPASAGELMKDVARRFDAAQAREFMKRALASIADASHRRGVWLAAPDVADEGMILEALPDPQMEITVAPIALKRRITAAWPILIESSSTAAKTAVAGFERYFAARKAYEDLKGALDGPDPALVKACALAKSANPDHRIAACYALAALNDRSAISVLLDLIHDERESVSAAALSALERLGTSPRPREDK